MSRPIVWACDGCADRVETDDYGLPSGWTKVTAMQPGEKNTKAAAEAEFCPTCSLSVNVAALARCGRELFAKTEPRRAKAKTASLDLGETDGDG